MPLTAEQLKVFNQKTQLVWTPREDGFLYTEFLSHDQINRFTANHFAALQCCVHFEQNPNQDDLEHPSCIKVNAEGVLIGHSQYVESSPLAWYTLWYNQIPVQDNSKEWKTVGSDFNFGQTKHSYFSQVYAKETILLDKTSSFYQNLLSSILELCKDLKEVGKILWVVNEKVDNLTTKAPVHHGAPRMDIEEGLTQQLIDYLEKRREGNIANKPASKEVPIEEVAELGLLICRHKGLLAAALLGDLITQKILPPGSARTYRSQIVYEKEGEVGGHQWAVYYAMQENLRWIIDPRWFHVMAILSGESAIFSYGQQAFEEMMSKLIDHDNALFENALTQGLTRADTLSDMVSCLEDYLNHRHILKNSKGTPYSQEEALELIKRIHDIEANPLKWSDILAAPDKSVDLMCIPKNYGLRKNVTEALKRANTQWEQDLLGCNPFKPIFDPKPNEVKPILHVYAPKRHLLAARRLDQAAQHLGPIQKPKAPRE